MIIWCFSGYCGLEWEFGGSSKESLCFSQIIFKTNPIFWVVKSSIRVQCVCLISFFFISLFSAYIVHPVLAAVIGAVCNGNVLSLAGRPRKGASRRGLADAL